MTNNGDKRKTIRYELAADETPYLSPASPAPPYSSFRNAASTGNLPDAVELPAEPVLTGSSPSALASLIGDGVKVGSILCPSNAFFTT
jgi:hypothetical protein